MRSPLHDVCITVATPPMVANRELAAGGRSGRFPGPRQAHLLGPRLPALIYYARQTASCRNEVTRQGGSSMGSGNAAALDMNTPERGALLRWMIFTGLSIF